MDPKVTCGVTEYVDAIRVHRGWHALEVKPAPDEGEGDRGGEDTAPHDRRVRRAAERATSEDEPVGSDLDEGATRESRGVACEETWRGERLPSATPVHARRRTLQPHRVAVRDAERGEQRRKSIADE